MKMIHDEKDTNILNKGRNSVTHCALPVLWCMALFLILPLLQLL